MIPPLLALSSEPQLIPTPVELCADVKTVLQEAVQAEVIYVLRLTTFTCVA